MSAQKRNCITLRIREKVLEIQKNRCVYCGKIFSDLKPTNHHRDHNQHNNHEDNITVCCEKCHRKMNTVETIYMNASDKLKQEIVYSILRVSPPSLRKELLPPSLHGRKAILGENMRLTHTLREANTI